MRYIALTRLSLANGAHVEPGQPVELPDAVAGVLLAQGAIAIDGEAIAAAIAPATPPSPRSTRRRR